MKEKNEKHTWEFTRYFRAGVYKWNGSALASKRIKEALSEIGKVAKKDPVLAAEGAVKFIEKCWLALEHIDSSSGAIGNAVNNALYELAEIISQAELPKNERLKLTERIWNSWEDEGYGYYDVLSELWPKLCGEPEIINYWADHFLPVVKQVFRPTASASYFKGSDPCLACLFDAGRYDEIEALLQTSDTLISCYGEYLIKVVAARGDIEKALSMIDQSLINPYIPRRKTVNLGEGILLKAGRVEEAYKKYGLMLQFESTGLATLSAIRKRYPTISPQRILSDLINADAGNERRYFAAARKIGMIELAIELAEKFDVEPKTLTTACKDYLEKDPDLSLKFGMLALQKYTDGFGYEPEFGDIQKCHDLVCMAAERVGRKDEITKKIEELVRNDKSSRKLVTSVVNVRYSLKDNIVMFRPRG